MLAVTSLSLKGFPDPLPLRRCQKPTSIAAILQALAEHGKGPITVRLNSGGGFVSDGVAIYNALKAHGDVTVSVDAIAASAADLPSPCQKSGQ